MTTSRAGRKAGSFFYFYADGSLRATFRAMGRPHFFGRGIFSLRFRSASFRLSAKQAKRLQANAESYGVPDPSGVWNPWVLRGGGAGSLSADPSNMRYSGLRPRHAALSRVEDQILQTLAFSRLVTCCLNSRVRD